ncbi:MAG: adenylyltransferase/cytidyltransferase family protein [Candidatus Aenigmarchaeota archaeon]|nr:adenylyltransferase/cytidyltransferase family protein [Candidatus Aenigmarchaeota archaeon]
MSKIILTGGKFNKIHPGHIEFLKYAKNLGRLTVVLANDNNNDRPYAIPAKERKERLERLQLADEIVFGDPKDFFAVVEKYNPDIIVVGYDQKLPVQVEERLKSYKKKIKIVKAEKYGDYRSSTWKD